MIVAHLCLHSGDLIFNNSGGRPQRITATDLQGKMLEDTFALQRMGNFWMELNTVEFFLFIDHTGDWARGC